MMVDNEGLNIRSLSVSIKAEGAVKKFKKLIIGFKRLQRFIFYNSWHYELQFVRYTKRATMNICCIKESKINDLPTKVRT